MNINPVVAGLIPSVVVGLLFWFVMRAVVRADRNERAALAEFDAQEAAAHQASVAKGELGEDNRS